MSNYTVLIQLFYAGLEYHFYHWEALWYRVINGALYYFCTLYNRKKNINHFGITIYITMYMFMRVDMQLNINNKVIKMTLSTKGD